MLHKLPTELLDQVVRQLVVPFDTPITEKDGVFGVADYAGDSDAGLQTNNAVAPYLYRRVQVYDLGRLAYGASRPASMVISGIASKRQLLELVESINLEFPGDRSPRGKYLATLGADARLEEQSWSWHKSYQEQEAAARALRALVSDYEATPEQMRNADITRTGSFANNRLPVFPRLRHLAIGAAGYDKKTYHVPDVDPRVALDAIMPSHICASHTQLPLNCTRWVPSAALDEVPVDGMLDRFARRIEILTVHDIALGLALTDLPALSSGPTRYELGEAPKCSLRPPRATKNGTAPLIRNTEYLDAELNDMLGLVCQLCDRWEGFQVEFVFHARPPDGGDGSYLMRAQQYLDKAIRDHVYSYNSGNYFRGGRKKMTCRVVEAYDRCEGCMRHA